MFVVDYTLVTEMFVNIPLSIENTYLLEEWKTIRCGNSDQLTVSKSCVEHVLAE